MKYILEIKPEYEDSFKGLMILGAKDSNLFVDTLAVENLEELNSDYINEHFGDLQDEAYQRGYKDCETRYCSFDACPNRQAEYQRGLNDAWEAAKKIFGYEIDGGIPIDEVGRVFGYSEDATFCTADIIRHNTASEAIAKLKAYEEKQNDKIEVGDEVEVLNSGNKYLVAWIAGTSICGFAHDGVTCRLQPSDVRKTGRHFDIASILEDMKHD